MPQVSKRVVMFQPGFLPQLQRGGGKHIIRIGQPFRNSDDAGAFYNPAGFAQGPHRVGDLLQDGDIITTSNVSSGKAIHKRCSGADGYCGYPHSRVGLIYGAVVPAYRAGYRGRALPLRLQPLWQTAVVNAPLPQPASSTFMPGLIPLLTMIVSGGCIFLRKLLPRKRPIKAGAGKSYTLRSRRMKTW